MTTTIFKFDIATSDAAAELGISVWIDNDCVLQIDHVKQPQTFSHTLGDEEGEHKLRITMSGKSPDHTQIDAQGNIVQDAMLNISGISIDNIDVSQLFYTHARYTHNFNGSRPEIEDQFFGDLGCNGSVNFSFSTPIYLWLLENM
jgi:hypothetical protein